MVSSVILSVNSITVGNPFYNENYFKCKNGMNYYKRECNKYLRDCCSAGRKSRSEKQASWSRSVEPQGLQKDHWAEIIKKTQSGYLNKQATYVERT